MPATVPAPALTPSTKLSMYERTTQSFIFNQVTANQTQTGTAAPANANIYGMLGTISRGQLPYNVDIQVDIGGTGALGAGPLVVTLLGSLDGTNFYALGTISLAAGVLGFLQTFSGLMARYLTASISGYTAAGGTPSVTVSLTA